MTFELPKDNLPAGELEPYFSLGNEKLSLQAATPLTHWELLRPEIPTALQIVSQPLIAAATHAESCRQMLKRNDSAEIIASAVESTLAEILLAGSGLHQLSDMLLAQEQAKLEAQQARSRTKEGAFLKTLATLTPREREILSSAVDGLDSPRIAAKLQISQRTVESHRANIARKFDVASLAELYRIAAALGISLPPGNAP